MGPKKATDVNGDELGTKRERDSYDAVFKLELIEMCTSGKYSSNAQALAAFNKLKQTSVTAGTMSKWLSSESKLRMQAADPSLKNKKHAKQSELPYVKESMRWWWYQIREKKGVVLSDDLLIQQALSYKEIVVGQFRLYNFTELAEKYERFQASSGWVQKFKLRYAVHSLKMKGEAAFVQDPDEDEVNKDLQDIDIVRLAVPEIQQAVMQQQQQDVVAAAEEDREVNLISLPQAQQYAEQLLHFISDQPKHFTSKEVCAVSALINHLNKVVIIGETRQASIRDYFQREPQQAQQQQQESEAMAVDG